MKLVAVRQAHRFDEAALGAYLAKHLDGFSGPLRVSQFDAGQSNPTFLLESESACYVLRKKPPGELLPKAHMVEREYRVMASLASTAVPVPRVLHLCEDSTIIGTPFFVMEFLEGRVFSDATLPEAKSEDRALLHEAMVATLAALHEVDYDALGLGDFGKPGNYFERQVSRWTRQYKAAQTDNIPSMDRLIAWLPNNAPVNDSTSLVHGDYRMDNVIFHPFEPRIIGVLDWELSTLGHPLADLAYYCQTYHVDTHHARLASLAGTASGIPTEAETIASYCRHTGRTEIADWPYYMAFSMFRLAGIAQGVYKRGLDGNASSPRALEMGKKVAVLSETAWALVES